MNSRFKMIALYALRLVLGLEWRCNKHDGAVRVLPGEPVPTGCPLCNAPA